MAIELVSVTFLYEDGTEIRMESDPKNKKWRKWLEWLKGLGGLLSGFYGLYIAIGGGGSGPPGGFRVKGQDMIIKSIRIERLTRIGD
jgi:uncharacterized membrane protein YfcA